MGDKSEQLPPLRLAVVGAGTFALAAWAPLLNSFAAKRKLVVTHVWSRSEASAKALSEALVPSPAKPFSFGEGSLGGILESDDVDAVLSVLPVQAMPEVTRRALRAGKAVLQEKPVAGTVAGALETLAVAREAAEEAKAAKKDAATVLPVYALAENYRSEPGVLAAAEAARDVVGNSKVTTINLVGNMPMDSNNRYAGSTWRRDPEGCPGCFLMDSCVHFVAALRAVAAAAGVGEPSRVGARAASRCVAGGDNDLPTPDTLCGFVEFGGKDDDREVGAVGTVTVTFAGATPRFALTVDGRGGAVELSRGGYGGSAGGGAANRGSGYTVAVSPRAGEPSSTFHPFGGLEAELESFLRLARGRGTKTDAEALLPASAARDLALIEALLASSADGGGVPKKVQKIGSEVDPLENGFGVE